MKTIYPHTLLLLCSLLLSVTANAATLTLGIVPQQSAKKLAKLWTPIASYLSVKSGHQIRFATAADIPTFEQRVLAGEYDIAYMNPYHYTVFHQKPGYQAIAKQANKKIKGIVVVRKDSPIQNLEELQGLKLAFPSPAAFAASVLPRSEIKKNGISFDPNYVSSHDSVYLGVAKGFFPAGGGIERTFNNTDPAVREQLRILWTTKGYTPHAIATHPRVANDVKEQIRQVILSMNDDPVGQLLLKSINFKGVEAASNSDWDDVRALDIDQLQHLLN
jgi:phosphonate transport system substrate-binding protein